jgi:hypothetical protein
MKEKSTWIVLPSVILAGIGVLSFSFPEFFRQDGGYVGYGGKNGFVVFIYRVLLYIFWGKSLGIVLIILGLMGIVFFTKEIFKKEEPVPLETEIKQKITSDVLSKFITIGKKQIKKSQKSNHS